MKEKKIHRHNQLLGRWGEENAARFLEGQGFSLVEMNYRTPEGEIDLIVQKGDSLVFCEVKTRTNNLTGYPEEAITEEKLEHMVAAAEFYLELHPEFQQCWRVDVIAVTGQASGQAPQIEWFEDAA